MGVTGCIVRDHEIVIFFVLLAFNFIPWNSETKRKIYTDELRFVNTEFLSVNEPLFVGIHLAFCLTRGAYYWGHSFVKQHIDDRSLHCLYINKVEIAEPGWNQQLVAVVCGIGEYLMRQTSVRGCWFYPGSAIFKFFTYRQSEIRSSNISFGKRMTPMIHASVTP